MMRFNSSKIAKKGSLLKKQKANLLYSAIQPEQSFLAPAFTEKTLPPSTVNKPPLLFRSLPSNTNSSIFRNKAFETTALMRTKRNFCSGFNYMDKEKTNNTNDNEKAKKKNGYSNSNITKAAFIGGITALTCAAFSRYLYDTAQHYWDKMKDEDKKKKFFKVKENMDVLRKDYEQLIPIFGSSFSNVITAYFDAEEAYKKHDNEKALRIIEEIIAKDPKKVKIFFFVPFLKSTILASEKKYQEAFDSVNSILSFNPWLKEISDQVADADTVTFIYMLLNNSLYTKKLYCLKKLNKIDEIEEVCLDFEESIGNIFKMQDQFGLSFEDIPLKVRVESSQIYYYRGVVHEKRGEHKEALANYNLALKINPIDAASHMSIANIMIQNDNFMGALEEVKCIIQAYTIFEAVRNEKIDKKYWSKTYAKVGEILFNLKEFDNAINSFNDALRYDENKEAYYGLGRINLIQKNYGAAELYFGQALSLDEEYMDALHGKITALEIQGKQDAANKEKKKDPFLSALEEARLVQIDILKKSKDANAKNDLIFPNQVGITTDYEYAWMCKQSYEEKPTITTRQLKERGWEISLNSSDLLTNNAESLSANRSGFFALCFLNRERKEIVIAFRGSVFPSFYEIAKHFATNSNEDIAYKIGVVETDLLFYFEKVSKQFAFAHSFNVRLKEVLKQQKIDVSSYRFSYTGHSLGAILAEVAAWQDGKAKAVTFESPGTKKLIENLEKNKKIDFESFKVTSYLSAPNVVNTAKPHLGTLIRIFPNAQHPSTVVQNKPKQLLSWLFHYGNQTAKQHNLDSILETFDDNTGLPLHTKAENPKYAKRIVSWPEGVYEYAVLQEMLLESPNQDPWERYLNEVQTYMIKYGAHYETNETSFFMMDIREMDENVRNFISAYEKDIDFKKQVDSKIGKNEKLKKVLANYKVDNDYVIVHCGLSANYFERYIINNAHLLGISQKPTEKRGIKIEEITEKQENQKVRRKIG